MALLITRCILFYNKMMKDLEGSQLAFPYKANPYKFYSRVIFYIQIFYTSMYAVLQMILLSIYFLFSYQNKNVDIVINDRELGYCIEINAENFSNVKGAFCCF